MNTVRERDRHTMHRAMCMLRPIFIGRVARKESFDVVTNDHAFESWIPCTTTPGDKWICWKDDLRTERTQQDAIDAILSAVGFVVEEKV